MFVTAPQLVSAQNKQRPSQNIDATATEIAKLQKKLEITKAPKTTSDRLSIAKIQMELGTLCKDSGQYQKAEPYLAEASKTYSIDAAGSLEETSALNHLASLYNNWGKFAKAERIQRQALALCQKMKTEDRGEIAVNKLLLADILRQQGNYKEAQPYLLEALAVLKEYRPNSREYAAALNNLGALYYWQGQYDKAEPLLNSGFELRKRICGENHIDTANSLGDLAALYFQKGDFRSAQARFEKALAIRKKELGANHPLTATTMTNLANVYATTDQPARAMELLRKALAVKEQALGANSPDLAQTLNDLAELYIDKKDFPKAEALAMRGKKIRESTLPKGNPDTAASLRTLGRLELAKGNPREALTYASSALSIYESALGPEHPETIDTQALLKAVKMKLAKAPAQP